MYVVILRGEEYSTGTTFTFEELADAMDFIERSISNGVPDKNGTYPSATLRFVL